MGLDDHMIYVDEMARWFNWLMMMCIHRLMQLRPHDRMSVARCVKIAIENTKSTYRKCCVDLKRSLARTHEVGFLDELPGIGTGYGIMRFKCRTTAPCWFWQDGLLNATGKTLTAVLMHNTFRMEQGFDGDCKLTGCAQLVLIDGHVLYTMLAGTE